MGLAAAAGAAVQLTAGLGGCFIVMKMTQSPPGDRTALGSCANAASTTPAKLYGPPTVREVACTTLLFGDQAPMPQSLVISAEYMCQIPVTLSSNTEPPQLLVRFPGPAVCGE